MDAMTRIEKALSAAVDRAAGPGCPPRLAAAVRHAVFPKGARLRPRLVLAVAGACRGDNPGLADAAAAAIELLHCASLVHDDLPCFDDADIRRGKPSVHKAFGEPLAVLTGDAMIVMAFETITRAGVQTPERLASLLLTVSRSVGMPNGIIAGQAWECEDEIDLAQYQQQKTGSLFSAATVAGAAAAGVEPEAWRMLGERLGEAYQVADDIKDMESDEEELGKPVHQDLALGRPSAVLQLGLDGAVRRLEGLIAGAVAAIPPCPGEADLRALIKQESKRLLPKKMAAQAA
ncbi:MAG: polyprenyl synthetase family protein [Elsteraceae bacterium]